jgi:hypothetical protein
MADQNLKGHMPELLTTSENFSPASSGGIFRTSPAVVRSVVHPDTHAPIPGHHWSGHPLEPTRDSEPPQEKPGLRPSSYPIGVPTLGRSIDQPGGQLLAF